MSRLTPDRTSALDAVSDALARLDEVFETIEESYEKSMKDDSYERFTAPKLELRRPQPSR